MEENQEMSETTSALWQESQALRDVLRHTSYLLEQRSREFALFRTMADTVNRAVAEPNALNLILRRIVEIAEAEHGAILLLDPKSRQLTLSAAQGDRETAPNWPRLAPGTGVAGWVFERGQGVYLKDAREDRQFGQSEIGEFTRALICMPLAFEGEILGTLSLAHRQPGYFDDDFPRLLEIILSQVAIAVRNLDVMNRHQDRAEILRRKNQQLEEANRQLAETQRELVKVERLRAVSELSISMNHEINNPLTAILGDAQYLLSSPQADDPVIRFYIDDIRRQCFRVADILEKLRNMEEAVSTRYADGLTMLDLERSAPTQPLIDRVQDSYYTLLSDSIRSWEEKSRYWRGHSARVCDLVSRMAKVQGLSSVDISRLRKLGAVWNVGLLTVDEHILMKSENLTKDEISQLERATARSRGMLAPLSVSLYTEGEDPAERGRERLSRYAPQVRDRALLDMSTAFIALVSDRPHRPALSPEAALREIRGGRQLDEIDIVALGALYRALDIPEAGDQQVTA